MSARARGIALRSLLGAALALWGVSSGCGDAGPAAPRPGGPSTVATPAAAPLPAPAPAPSPSPATPAATDGARVTIAGGLSYVVPAGWQDLGSAGMRAAQYKTSAVGGDVEVEGEGQAGAAPPELRVFYFGPGQGGPVDGNLDRWSGQFSDQPDAPVIAAQGVGDFTVHTLDVRGTFEDAMAGGGPTGPGCRMLAAIVVAEDGDQWFLKLVGPEAGVAAAEPGFRALCASVRRAR